MFDLAVAPIAQMSVFSASLPATPRAANIMLEGTRNIWHMETRFSFIMIDPPVAILDATLRGKRKVVKRVGDYLVILIP
jgi:hypothetical protein